MTKRVHQGTAIGGVAFGAAVMAGALELQFYTRLGPGPGFFPFILGAIFALLSLSWFVQCTVRKSGSDSKPFLPDKAALFRVGAIIAGLVGIRLFMNLLGFQITMFLFLFLLVKFLGGRKPVESALVSLAGSVGVYLLFGKVLGLMLPPSGIPFLAAVGL